MTRLLPLLRLLLAVLALAVLAAPATAQTTPGGSGGGTSGGNPGGGGDVTVGIIVGESLPGYPGGGPGDNRATGTTAQVNLITYGWRGPLPGNGCGGLGAELPGGPVIENDLYQYVRYDRTLEPPVETVLETTCFPPDDPPENIAPPPPPAPPTLAEITAVAQGAVIAPAVGVSPPGDGLTGLETWFWYQGQDEVTVSTSIRGYEVVATMAPITFVWETGDARPGHLLTSTSPGSATAPAASWVYETKAAYRVYVQAVWDGTWTFSGWGSSAQGGLATIRATGARDYVVNEVRSVLTG